jgi:hypothetical protein
MGATAGPQCERCIRPGANVVPGLGPRAIRGPCASTARSPWLMRRAASVDAAITSPQCGNYTPFNTPITGPTRARAVSPCPRNRRAQARARPKKSPSFRSECDGAWPCGIRATRAWSTSAGAARALCIWLLTNRPDGEEGTRWHRLAPASHKGPAGAFRCATTPLRGQHPRPLRLGALAGPSRARRPRWREAKRPSPEEEGPGRSLNGSHCMRVRHQARRYHGGGRRSRRKNGNNHADGKGNQHGPAPGSEGRDGPDAPHPCVRGTGRPGKLP